MDSASMFFDTGFTIFPWPRPQSRTLSRTVWPWPRYCLLKDVNLNIIDTLRCSEMNSYQPSTRWSQCSKDELVRSIDEDLDYCLHNVPQTIYDNTPDCGNGIVDQGEECDCGNAPASVWLLSSSSPSSSSSTTTTLSSSGAAHRRNDTVLRSEK